MANGTSNRPVLSPEMERCVAAAKAFAAVEPGPSKLDSLHLVLAAIRTVPQAAKAALEEAGYCWGAAQKACPPIEQEVPEEVARRSMPLVEALREVVCGWIGRTEGTDGQAAMSTEVCLKAVLEHPSVRLRGFLRRVRAHGDGRTRTPGGSDDRPYRSFREFLAARREVWRLRQTAARHIQVLRTMEPARGCSIGWFPWMKRPGAGQRSLLNRRSLCDVWPASMNSPRCRPRSSRAFWFMNSTGIPSRWACRLRSGNLPR